MSLHPTRRAFAGSVLLGLSGLGGKAFAQTQEPVRVGVLLSLTGPAAPFGIPERDTFKTLADKINADGGLNGRKLELFFQDDQTNPTETARGATKLIQQDKVVAIFGPTMGSGALAMMPIAARAQVPVLAPVGTIPVTAKDSGFFPWVFRTCPDDNLSIAVTLDKVILKGGYKRLAVMFQEDAYGKNGAALVERFAKERNIEIVTQASAPASAVDLSAAATRVRSANPDIVLLWTSAPAMSAAFVRTSRQIGMNAPFVGSGGTMQRSFVDAAGPASEGMSFATFALWDEPLPRLKALDAVLRASGKPPSGFGEQLAATAMAVLAEGVRKVRGPITGAALRDAIESICGLENPYIDMSICFGPDDHEAFDADSMHPVVIKDGRFRWAPRT